MAKDNTKKPIPSKPGQPTGDRQDEPDARQDEPSGRQPKQSRDLSRAMTFGPDEIYNGFELLDALKRGPYGEAAPDVGYNGSARIDLSGVPIYIKTAFRRVLAYVESEGGKIGIGEMLACLAHRGVRRLVVSPEIEAWAQLAELAKSLPDLSAREEITLDQVIHSHGFELPDPPNKGRERWAFLCSEEVRREIYGAAQRKFGLKGPQLARVGILVWLGELPGVNPEANRWMHDTVDQFLAGYQERAEELRLRMEMYQRRP